LPPEARIPRIPTDKSKFEKQGFPPADQKIESITSFFEDKAHQRKQGAGIVSYVKPLSRSNDVFGKKSNRFSNYPHT
jgi:hypothetical protein